MNWDAISAIGQLAGAIAVVVTVGYLAVQIRIARLAASDANRLQRGAGVREMIFNVLNNEQLRRATDKSERYGDTIGLLAQHPELSEDEASLAMWACMAWWWIHWTQWASIKTQRDEEELRNLVSLFYRSRTMSAVWNLHPGVGLLEPDFRKFVIAALEAEPGCLAPNMCLDRPRSMNKLPEQWRPRCGAEAKRQRPQSGTGFRSLPGPEGKRTAVQAQDRPRKVTDLK